MAIQKDKQKISPNSDNPGCITIPKGRCDTASKVGVNYRRPAFRLRFAMPRQVGGRLSYFICLGFMLPGVSVFFASHGVGWGIVEELFFLRVPF